MLLAFTSLDGLFSHTLGGKIGGGEGARIVEGGPVFCKPENDCIKLAADGSSGQGKLHCAACLVL